MCSYCKKYKILTQWALVPLWETLLQTTVLNNLLYSPLMMFINYFLFRSQNNTVKKPNRKTLI